MPPPPWTVWYHDGNGNRFRFWQDSAGQAARFSYDPVRRDESSSGLYDGGDPADGSLEAWMAVELWRQVRDVEDNPVARADTRMKGSGEFSLTSADGTRTFQVGRGSLLQAWDTFVKSLVRG